MPALPFIKALAAGGADNADLVYELGFGARRLGPLGPVASELDPVQRGTLEVFARKEFADAPTVRRRLGFLTGEAIGRLLAQKGPLYRPLDVETAGGTKRWHALYLWRACARDKVPEKAAFAAITKALDPGGVAEVALSAEEWAITYEAMRGPDDWKRDRSLSLALFAWLETKDGDWPRTVKRWMKKDGRGPNVGIAILRLWGKKKIALDEEAEEAIGDAVLDALDTTTEGVADVARALPTELKQRIVADNERSVAPMLKALLGLAK